MMGQQEESKYTHYSVKRPVLINGQRRVPSVCYPIAPLSVKAMEQLAAKGTVILYDRAVRFVSGALKADPAPAQAPAADLAPAPAPVEETAAPAMAGEFAPPQA
jgi:hypothetical protein